MEVQTTGQGAAQPHGEKAEWKAPTLEEVHYSATEISGVGGVYDFTVYSGSA